MQEADDSVVELPVSPELELLNLTKLAFRFDLDKTTVKKRITNAGIEPVSSRYNEKIYELTPRLAAVLEQVNDQLDEAKLRQATADAELKEAKVAQIHGELVKASEMVNLIQQIFGTAYRMISVQMWNEIAARLAKAKTAADVKRIGKAATDRRFKTLKDSFEKFLKEWDTPQQH